MSQIRGGMSLKKSHTNDRSTPASGGGVLGDSAPPSHISNVAREHEGAASPEPESEPEPAQPPQPAQQPPQHLSKSIKDNRQSVDWISGLASEGGAVAAAPDLDHVAEESSHDDDYVKVPSISVDPSSTLAEEFDMDKGGWFR